MDGKEQKPPGHTDSETAITLHSIELELLSCSMLVVRLRLLGKEMDRYVVASQLTAAIVMVIIGFCFCYTKGCMCVC